MSERTCGTCLQRRPEQSPAMNTRTRVRQHNSGSLPIGTAKRTPLPSKGSGVRALPCLLPTSARNSKSRLTSGRQLRQRGPQAELSSGPTNSGQVRSPSCGSQGHSIMLGRSTPSCPVRAGLTKVVSMANCTPPNRRSPSATTSIKSSAQGLAVEWPSPDHGP